MPLISFETESNLASEFKSILKLSSSNKSSFDSKIPIISPSGDFRQASCKLLKKFSYLDNTIRVYKDKRLKD